MAVMTIGQLARRSGVSIDTIRFYEKAGLLQPAWREPSGFRKYTEEALGQLAFIRRAQDIGFTLKEIRHLLLLREQQYACSHVQEQLEQKLTQVRQKLEQLHQLERELQEQLELCRRRQVTATTHQESDCPVLKLLSTSEPSR